MEKLQAYVSREFGKQGARVIVSHDHTLLILDCPIWTERSTRKIKHAFPDVDVEVESTEHSLSGFVVILHRGKAGAKHVSMACFAGVLAVLLYVAVSF